MRGLADVLSKREAAGDAAGFMNSVRLKGIHLAMRTGMLAAETAFDAVRRGDTSETAMKAYDDRIQTSAVRRDHSRSRDAGGSRCAAGLFIVAAGLKRDAM